MENELRMHVHGREERCLHSVMGKYEGKRLCVTLSCRWEGYYYFSTTHCSL